MNLLILSSKIPYPANDGGAIATLSLAQSLSHFIPEIDILSINTKKHFFDIKNIPEQITKSINFFDVYRDTTLTGLKFLKNLFFSKLPYNAERFIFKDFKIKLIKLLSGKQYDIIQIEGLYMLPYIPIIRKHSKALISYRAHNIEHEIWQRRIANMNFSVKRIYLKILLKRLIKFEKKQINKYDVLIPITKRDGLHFEALGNLKRKIIIPLGLKQDEYLKYTKIEAEFPTIFHIGALDWSPNQEGLMWFFKKVWPKVLKKAPELKFFIAGRNAPKWLEKEFNLKNIVYLGEIDDAKKFIASKSIMIVPLLSGSGMRVKIIEGMALSKAIISTSIGVEGIPAQNGEHILIADTEKEMLEAILELSKNQKKVEEMGQNAKIFVYKYFDNFVVAKKLYEFYENLLKIRN